MTVTCVCGKEFNTYPSRIKRGKGKFCSDACRSANQTRRSGLTYQKHKENPTSFKPGHTLNLTGADHPNWKGDEIGYRELHRWVARMKGERPTICEGCRNAALTEWANVSHEYRRDVNDWAALCRLCHRLHDSGEARGKATAKYGRRAVQEGY